MQCIALVEQHRAPQPLAQHSRSSCLGLIAEHLRHIAGERDRTALGRCLLAALQEVFLLSEACLYRYTDTAELPLVFPVAVLGNGHIEVKDAYRLSPQRGQSLTEHPGLVPCLQSGEMQLGEKAGRAFCVIPLFRHERIDMLLRMERALPFHEADVALMLTITAFFNEHIALIEYAQTDTLTGLLNRKTFDEHLDRVLASVSQIEDDRQRQSGDVPKRRAGPAAPARNWLAIIDIDHFKRINDTHGHLIGDEMLLLLAQTMREAFRLEDPLFRFGGEEFIAILQPTTFEAAEKVINRFRHQVETRHFPIVGQVTISAGFTAIDPADTPTDLIDRADKALYYAKENGRNRVENYETLQERGLLDHSAVHASASIELF